MPKYCTSCGNEITINAKFCPACGCFINDVSNNTESTAVPVKLPQTIKYYPTDNSSITNGTVIDNVSDIENDDDDLTGLRNKIENNRKKNNVSSKKIIITLLCVAVLAAGAVTAFLLLSDNDKNKPQNESAHEISSVSELQESSIASSDTSVFIDESSDEIVDYSTWETREIDDHIKDLDVPELSVGKYTRNKYVTNINVERSSLSAFITSRYIKSDNDDIILNDSIVEDIYTRLSDGVDFCGTVDEYNAAIVNTKTHKNIAECSYKTVSSVFDGVSEFQITLSYDKTANIQELCEKDLSSFVSEELAEYLVYGKGNSIPDIDKGNGDMEYSGTINNDQLSIFLERTIKNNSDSCSVSFAIKYESVLTEDEMKLYFDDNTANVYDEAHLNINNFITGTQNVDYKKSHEFMSDVFSSFVPEDSKFIDTKLESMKVTELSKENMIKTSYSFRTAVGITNTKYTDAPYADFKIEGVSSDNTISDYNVLISGDTKNDDPAGAADMISSLIEAMYPKLNKELSVASIATALGQNKEYTEDYEVTVFGDKTMATLTVKKDDTVKFTFEYKKLSEEDIPKATDDEVKDIKTNKEEQKTEQESDSKADSEKKTDSDVKDETDKKTENSEPDKADDSE